MKNTKIRGGVIGLLVGDALGVPYAFRQPSKIPPMSEIEYRPPLGVHPGFDQVEPGSWSEGGAHALALMASLVCRSVLDPDDLLERLHDWYARGTYAVDRCVFDAEGQTVAALSSFARGTPSNKCGADDRGSNGSLVRMVPLALWHRGDDAELVYDAMLQSRVTHAHTRSQVCCALLGLWVRYVFQGQGIQDSWFAAARTFRVLYADTTEERQTLEHRVRPEEMVVPRGSGSVIDSLRSVTVVADAGSYEDVVRQAVSLGGNTHASAAMAGAISGAYKGEEAIPQRWRDDLRMAPEHARLVDEFVAACLS
ncbi:MAG: ADP-ribosylglycohydrolase family protein [Myxococcales bacterium]|nr:ADP-ribosylglycohydrolase family protein [Myxococcales bacterium]